MLMLLMHTYGPPDNGKRVLGSPQSILKLLGGQLNDMKCLLKMTGLHCNFRHLQKLLSFLFVVAYCCLCFLPVYLRTQKKLQLYWSLWVGSSMTPNIFFRDGWWPTAFKKYMATKTDAMRRKFPFFRCSKCQKKFAYLL